MDIHIRIKYHPGRMQPYTVYYKGSVVKFCKTAEEVQELIHASNLKEVLEEVGTSSKA